MTAYQVTAKSRNAKTGPLMVTTSSSDTCPEACPFKQGGCYAKGGPLAILWNKLDKGQCGTDLDGLCSAIEGLPEGTLWRHNQAGDLPGQGDMIDGEALKRIVVANSDRRGYTYTHKPMDTEHNRNMVYTANKLGFTVNLSANTLPHADDLADLGIGPVVTVLPSDHQGNCKTPKGRKVVVCPAITHDNVTCATCGLCALQRDVIVGFPAHGPTKKKADAIARA